jgi:hypothetical protein
MATLIADYRKVLLDGMWPGWGGWGNFSPVLRDVGYRLCSYAPF